MAFDQLVVSFLVDEVFGGFFISVPPGHVACVYDRGRGVLSRVWKPGLHLKIPFWQKAKLFNARTLEYGIRKGGFDLNHKEALGDEPVNAVTSDNKTITIEGTILLKIDKERVNDLWENIGEDFVSKIVRPVSRSRIRAIISNFTADEVISTQRGAVENAIRHSLEEFMGEKGIIVEQVLLSEIESASKSSL